MQTRLSEQALQAPRAEEAERILRSCVHCGFCNATCPTYQLLGDELDGPRGRIYQIKHLLEGQPASALTRQHLDRCLGCRSCETTCPSGVDYHHLLDIGRATLDQALPRPASERWLRWGLRRLAEHPRSFGLALRVGSVLKPLLPSRLQEKIPGPAPAPSARPARRHARHVLILEGCVQPGLSPNTNAAAARVLDRLGISVQPAHRAGCCGALAYHLDAQSQGLMHARANIDAWWPALQSGAEAIVQTASGCGAFIKDYAHLLAEDAAYAEKARVVSERALDLAQVLAREPLETALPRLATMRVAFHCPCSLQHAQGLGGVTEALLRRLGFELADVPDAHLCCGSAGTYSITQPALAKALRDRKLDALESGGAAVIATANVGCQNHLASAGRTPVRHWVELLDLALS
ncbi:MULTISPECIES: glycolate oxidase subunit GlcF [unclassified Pseudomonas]|uniref:glycolate oxidase subunit GlcF n=1 Tax=unclassified Pseudomonas TaxID=196821 RepID=UPI000BCBAA34|nr:MULTISPECIES: glycolate oxidase subunit GlcF [unclassified Pseudomonas]PVZ13774.1 glycolate oxidase iron-sulfur subunit [Pseudomonas sp. URIL14HWK12:I12]PVZ24080.1 glycolate oxidase iron-sulfur subunit [Pseudomonas sp. URIL14HWK12:I10]PVZ33281.1 glycolate oxidase iron-sulfur subunit [Pseudomonas sp. URIL14HWK12:I11]SNZ10990.1 glycolate oxidase iron-sulfur subunit [Pseudomonas sp. URIL14HWK12:I9]